MDLEFYKIDDKFIVNLIGELDHHNAEEVRVKIDDRIDRDSIKKLILNFKDVTFMDSSGIGAVVGRYKKITSKGGTLCVTEVNRGVYRVFKLSGLFKFINGYSDVTDALKHI